MKIFQARPPAKGLREVADKRKKQVRAEQARSLSYRETIDALIVPRRYGEPRAPNSLKITSISK